MKLWTIQMVGRHYLFDVWHIHGFRQTCIVEATSDQLAAPTKGKTHIVSRESKHEEVVFSFRVF